MSYTDTVRFISKHINRIPEIAMAKPERDASIRKWLEEFHSTGCDMEKKVELQNNIIQAVYFLFPYFLKGKYTSMQLIQDDIAQIMVINTIEAINNYNPARRTKFTSYLVGYLRNAVATAYKEAQVVSNPSYARRETIASLERMACGKSSENGEDPTDEEIDKASSKLAKAFPDAIYLEEAPVDKDTIPATAATACGDVPINAEIGLLVNEQVYVLAHILSDTNPLLSKREKLVLKHRFGVFGHDKLTLEEVSERFKLRKWNATKEWVHQLEKRALKKVLQEFQELNF